MYLLLGCAAIIVVLALVIRYLGRYPVVHRNLESERFPWLLFGLLRQMNPGAVLVIQQEESPRFVQFVVESEPSGRLLLGFGFPDAPWSRLHFEPVRRALKSSGWTSQESSTGDSVVTRFLEVEIRGEIEDLIQQGSRIALVAFRAMEVPNDARFNARIEGELDNTKAKVALYPSASRVKA